MISLTMYYGSEKMEEFVKMKDDCSVRIKNMQLTILIVFDLHIIYLQVALDGNMLVRSEVIVGLGQFVSMCIP